MNLHEVVSLQECIGSDDGQGGESLSEEWVTIVSKIYADVTPSMSSRGGNDRRYFSDSMQQVITYRVMIRARTGVVQWQRFLWKTHKLRIDAIYDLSGNADFLICDCTEII